MKKISMSLLAATMILNATNIQGSEMNSQFPSYSHSESQASFVWIDPFNQTYKEIDIFEKNVLNDIEKHELYNENTPFSFTWIDPHNKNNDIKYSEEPLQTFKRFTAITPFNSNFTARVDSVWRTYSTGANPTLFGFSTVVYGSNSNNIGTMDVRILVNGQIVREATLNPGTEISANIPRGSSFSMQARTSSAARDMTFTVRTH